MAAVAPHRTAVPGQRLFIRSSSLPASGGHRQRTCRAVGCQAQQQQQQQVVVCRPIEVSRSIAAARAAESSRPDRLLYDQHAAALCHQAAGASSSSSVAQQQQQQQTSVMMDIIATQYIDESLQNAMAATNVNSIQSGDYRQVVLVGDGMDTRPFRLLWPPGTLLFSVAPAEVHEQAEAELAAAQPPAHVMRGCLLRRVNMRLAAAAADTASVPSGGAASAPSAAAAGDSFGAANSSSSLLWRAGTDDSTVQASLQQPQPSIFMNELLRSGFRADRLSVWVLQGLHGQGLGQHHLQQLLAEIINCAAFHSLFIGELPGPMSRREAENLLAEAGLLGAVTDYQAADGGQYGRWKECSTAAAAATAAAATAAAGMELQAGGDSPADAGGADQIADRWLCTAQQLRLSLEQMGIYEDWSAEYEENDAGDDYIGNFT